MSSLRFGVLVPILYFATLIGAALVYPGYSHVRQYASELGSANAPYPWIFNIATIAGGLCVLMSLRGFRAALRKGILNWLFLISLAGFGIGFVMGGLFPMPNPLHGGLGLGFGIHLAPLFLIALLWREPDLRGLRAFMIVVAIASLTMLAIMMGVGGLVRRANVGLFQRMYALTTIPWIGISAYALLRRRR